MKRFYSILLVGCLLFTCCVLFASCSAVSEKDVLADPYSVIDEATDNTLSAFFTDDAGIGNAIIGMLPKGEMSVSFESDDVDGSPLNISEKIYYDITERSFVFDTAFAYDDVDLSFRIFSDEDNFALNGSDILGSDKTLLVNFDTFIEKFEDSEFVNYFGLDKTTVEEMLESVKTAKESVDVDEDESLELNKAIYSILLDNVTTEKVVNSNEKNVNCIVAEFKVDNEKIDKVFDEIKKYSESDENGDESSEDGTVDIWADANNDIADVWNDIKEDTDIQFSVKVYLNKRTNEFVKIVLDGTVTEEDFKETPTVMSGEVLFGETEITFDFTVETDEEPLYVYTKLTKEVSSADCKYSFTVDANFERQELDVLNVLFNYNKSNGDISLSAEVYEDEENSNTAVLEGNLSVSKEKISLLLDTLKINDDAYNFKLEMSLSAVDSIPEIPEDAKDLVDIKYGGWTEIINEFQNSKFGKLLFGDLDSEF